MNKNLLRILAVVALGAVIAAGLYFYNKRHSNETTQSFTAQKKDLAVTEIPKGFPANFPMEAGSEVLKNYESTGSDGRFQSTRQVTTKKTLDQAVKIYTDFFGKLGYTLQPTESRNDSVVLAFMRKGDDTLMIVGRTNEATKQKTVEVTLTQAVK